VTGAARTAAGLLLAALACASETDRSAAPHYQYNRVDYERFRAGHPDLFDPNYLPFMAHRIALRDGEGDALVFCRWDDARFPLAVTIEAPEISEDLQDDLDPIEPADYVAAVRQALAAWERALEGRVRFRDAGRGRPDLRLRLVGAEAPTPEPNLQVLGSTAMSDACRAAGDAPRDGRLDVEFAVAELRIYVADQHGLLQAAQVERVALHELGHALGMPAHSPIPADLMYEVVRDRVGPEKLSVEDANSYLSLYGLPNGTLFTRVPPDWKPPPPPGPPAPGPPRLAAAPYVNVARGFQLRLPEDWMRVETEQGVIAVDGTTWDYTASLQLIVLRYPSVEAYLDRHLDAHLRGRRVSGWSRLVVRGRAALRVVALAREGELLEETTFLASGDGRVVVAIAECPSEHAAIYRTWFWATLGSLDLWRDGPASEPRDR
jgi:hypothetical protein